MATLARFRLEAAKTRSCRLCNTAPRISHWIDGHSALATTSDAGCLSLLYWQAPFQRIPLYKTDASRPVRRNRQSKWHYAEPPSNIARSATRAATSMCLSLASHDLASRSDRVTKRPFGLSFS